MFIRSLASILTVAIGFGITYGTVATTTTIHEGFEIAIAAAIVAIVVGVLFLIWEDL